MPNNAHENAFRKHAFELSPARAGRSLALSRMSGTEPMKPAQAPRRSLLPLLVLAVLAGLVIGAVWWATRKARRSAR